MYGESVLSEKSAQIWIIVDPLSDKYPSMSPYHYCSNNPIRRIDPNGMLDGDFFDWNGKYLGTDGNTTDNKVYIVGDRKSTQTIRENDKKGGTTDANSVNVDVSTNKSVIREIVGVSNRTTTNGDTREEATMMTTDGGRYTGQGPDIRNLGWDQTPDATVDVTGDIDVSIHSHLSTIRTNPNGSGEIKASSALRPSTADRAIRANLNVITGPLGDPTWIGTPQGSGTWSTASEGAAFYDSGWQLKGSMNNRGLRNILNR